MTEKAKTIILTGGGSAGHVTPNIALISKLQENNWSVHYIGTAHGIEKQLISPLNVPYHIIPSGKLRRYFSWQNFIDPFKVLAGVIKSVAWCFRIKPAVIFSKGGFVSLPVVIAGYLTRTPVILHESDLTPALANKLRFPFAKKILLTFDETQKYFKDKNKLMVTGTPIRSQLFLGDKQKGLVFAGLDGIKPVILIICGSLGSKLINETVRAILPSLLNDYSVIHICGKDQVNADLMKEKNYQQFEYIHDELADVFACADIVISRSGANSLSELLALKKLAVLIPLSKKASRGDQIDNARFAKEKGLAVVLKEEELSDKTLLEKINEVTSNKKALQDALFSFSMKKSLDLIYQELNNLT